MGLLPFRRPSLSLGISAQLVWLEGAYPSWRTIWPTCRAEQASPPRRERVLPVGLVVPSATALNVSDVPALAKELGSLCGSPSCPWWATPVALNLPDQCARVALLDFEAWPQKEDEAGALLRWRLKKDLNQSTTDVVVVHRAFRVGASAGDEPERVSGGAVRVLVVTIQRNILEQYEQACEAAGLLPVVIRLTALHFFDLHRPTLPGPKDTTAGPSEWFFLHVTEDGLTFLAVHDHTPTFIRIKSLRRDRIANDPAALASEVLATLQFHDAQYHKERMSVNAPPRILFACGALQATQEGMADVIGAMHTTVVPLSSSPPRRQGSKEGRIGRYPGILQGGWLRRLAPMAGRAQSRLPSLSLPLATKGLGMGRLVQWGLAGLVAVCLVSALWAWHSSRSLIDQAVQYERASQRVEDANRLFAQQAKQAGITLSEGRAKSLEREVLLANRLMEQQAFSWTQLLTDLEETVQSRVTISSVGLNFKDRVVTVNGSALTLKDLTIFVDDLEKHTAFQNVVLAHHRIHQEPLQHTSKTEGSPSGNPTTVALREEVNNTVEFTMTVAYQPTSNPEKIAP